MFLLVRHQFPDDRQPIGYHGSSTPRSPISWSTEVAGFIMQCCTQVTGRLAMAAVLLASWGVRARGQEAAPDFFLPDVNTTSPTYGRGVSPRNYLEQVSGSYFGYST
jgi:hypothetical protein